MLDGYNIDYVCEPIESRAGISSGPCPRPTLALSDVVIRAARSRSKGMGGSQREGITIAWLFIQNTKFWPLHLVEKFSTNPRVSSRNFVENFS